MHYSETPSLPAAQWLTYYYRYRKVQVKQNQWYTSWILVKENSTNIHYSGVIGRQAIAILFGTTQRVNCLRKAIMSYSSISCRLTTPNIALGWTWKQNYSVEEGRTGQCLFQDQRIQGIHILPLEIISTVTNNTSNTLFLFKYFTYRSETTTPDNLLMVP